MLAGSWTTFCSGEFLTHFRIAQQPKHCRPHNRYHMRPDCAFSDPWSINWTPWCRLLARSLWHKVAVDRDMSLIWTSRRNFCVFKLVELFDYLNRMQALLRVIQIYIFFPVTICCVWFPVKTLFWSILGPSNDCDGSVLLKSDLLLVTHGKSGHDKHGILNINHTSKTPPNSRSFRAVMCFDSYEPWIAFNNPG